MAHKYGRNLGSTHVAILGGAMAATMCGATALGVNLVARSGDATASYHMNVDPRAAHLEDPWESQLLDLLDFICRFLGVPAAYSASASPETQAAVTQFIQEAAWADVPANANPEDVDAVLVKIASARSINDDHASALTLSLSQDLEDALAALEAEISPAAASRGTP